MELYLMQHGLAVPADVDPARPLTEVGRAEVVAVTEAAAAAHVTLDEVWHSGKLRAEQTARLLAAGLPGRDGPAPAMPRGGLDPGSDVAPIAGWVRGVGAPRRVAIVGHLPFLDRLVGLLVAGSPDSHPLAIRNAGLVRLVRGEGGHFQVAWILTPDLLPRSH